MRCPLNLRYSNVHYRSTQHANTSSFVAGLSSIRPAVFHQSKPSLQIRALLDRSRRTQFFNFLFDFGASCVLIYVFKLCFTSPQSDNSINELHLRLFISVRWLWVIGLWIAVKNKSVHCMPCTVDLFSTNRFGTEWVSWYASRHIRLNV